MKGRKQMLIKILMAGIFSAAFAYLCNKVIVSFFSDRGLVILAPLVEEVAKTGFAILLQTSIIGGHFVFGLIEGVYDIYTSPKKTGKWAALASVISHSFFGIITYFFDIKTGLPLAGIGLAWIFHSSWNCYIIKNL